MILTQSGVHGQLASGGRGAGMGEPVTRMSPRTVSAGSSSHYAAAVHQLPAAAATTALLASPGPALRFQWSVESGQH